MADSDWDSGSGGKGKIIILSVITFILVTIAIVLFLNNREAIPFFNRTFSKVDSTDIQKNSFSISDSLNDPEITTKMTKTASSKKITKTKTVKKKVAKKTSKPLNKEVTPTYTVDISKVRCKLADKKPIEIFISLKLIFNNNIPQKEILLSRGEIKVKVQQIMATKKMDSVKVKELRAELLKVIGDYLGKSALIDIEFTDFRPVDLVK